MQEAAAAGEAAGVVEAAAVVGLGEAVRISGGEAGMEEHKDTGDDATSISATSSAGSSSMATSSLSPHPSAELGCADWTLQNWPAPSNREAWCQHIGVGGEIGLEGSRMGMGEGDSGGTSWRRVSRMLSSNRDVSSGRNMGISRPHHALMG